MGAFEKELQIQEAWERKWGYQKKKKKDNDGFSCLQLGVITVWALQTNLGAIFWQYSSVCLLLCLGWEEQQLKYILQLLHSKYLKTIVGCTVLPVVQGTVRQRKWIAYSHVFRIGYIFPEYLMRLKGIKGWKHRNETKATIYFTDSVCIHQLKANLLHSRAVDKSWSQTLLLVQLWLEKKEIWPEKFNVLFSFAGLGSL